MGFLSVRRGLAALVWVGVAVAACDAPRPVCGNGIVEQGEQCDDASSIRNDGCRFCRHWDVLPGCGDGVIGFGEQCDDGDAESGDGCSSRCEIELCGDGLYARGEACDDGNFVSGDGCEPDCTPTICRGRAVPRYECEDDNDDDTDGCTNLCAWARCGDGVVWEGVELCDDGNDIDDDSCTNACRPRRCGDFIVGPGEECDDGRRDPSDGCTDLCLWARCGDGVVGPGESCDPGDASSTCTSTCTPTPCLAVGAPECDVCDEDDTDGCLSTLELARCGDGVVWHGVEGCDDGNLVDGDGCSSVCGLPTCGNGVIDPGEGCDDGNVDERDACTNACMPAQCGDRIVWRAVEACDDGDLVDDHSCNSECELDVCGDGRRDPSREACDDGVEGGFCDERCARRCELEEWPEFEWVREIDGGCYLTGGALVTRDEALEVCHGIGAELVSVGSEEVAAAVALGAAESHLRRVWTALERRGERWANVGGAPITWLGWAPREPSENEDEDVCVVLHSDSTGADFGLLLDEPCDTRRRFTCEYRWPLP